MSKFQPVSFYKNKKKTYQLTPFRFLKFNQEKYFLSNMTGEYLLLDRESLGRLVEHRLNDSEQSYLDLRAKQFLIDDTDSIATDLLAIKTRTRYSRLPEFTALHIFVVSLRCDHSCQYCQVSRQSADKLKYDMTEEIADKAIDFAFKSPSRNIKIEFQGGESLLNFPIIQYIVERSKKLNEVHCRNLDFVIATNLSMIDRDILGYCRLHGIHISTSLDGPEDLHNKNRPRPGKDSYEKVIKGISLCREVLGRDEVSALMTTTEASLKRGKEIVDEYLKLGFPGIFLRSLSPYGYAIKTKSFAAYQTEQWLDFFKESLDYIIELNRSGIRFQEYCSAIVLSKMLTSSDPGFVDLMSPAGIGISVIVYNYDGSVHPSDESRMLAEMGDNTFKMGNVLTDSYEQVFSSQALLQPLEDSYTNSVPMCEECAYEPYCGADPVYEYAMNQDYIGRRPDSGFCQKSMGIFKHLIKRMEEDPFVKNLFMDWANRK